MRFDHHTVVLLIRPRDLPDLPAEAVDRIHRAHLAHQAGLVDEGHVIAAGPLGDSDGDGLLGLLVLGVDPAMARELYANDPAVRAGWLAVRVLSWRVPEGNVRIESVPIPHAVLRAAAGD